MRAIIQRANGASVKVAGEVTGQFSGPGLVILVGFTHSDGEEQLDYLVRRIVKLAILEPNRPASTEDETSGSSRELALKPVPCSVLEAEASVLVVSQFTLYGTVKKGRKPSWTHAAPSEVARPLYESLLQKLRAAGIKVESGVFGAQMEVSLTNDGPFTLWIEK